MLPARSGRVWIGKSCFVPSCNSVSVLSEHIKLSATGPLMLAVAAGSVEQRHGFFA
ncbi:hypothetical protein M404DRAFT_1007275 [Pisolithus tinctorius Marx 270]|uniref:Uncharacterized protein n=1 Tax=Pisolithus tinctorius Marx 270 TaxID=870435 RepID=A0A0C3NJW9_PISTI|nr:hypothetical protein M404DRAFT_1007275 [Pisolithus tinctorius Marx 270]